MIGRVGAPTDRWMDGFSDQQTDGPADGWMRGRMEKCTDVCMDGHIDNCFIKFAVCLSIMCSVLGVSLYHVSIKYLKT